MKHAARKTTSMLLSTLLLGSSCLMGVSADTVSPDRFPWIRKIRTMKVEHTTLP